jgi:hypothetical protein
MFKPDYLRQPPAWFHTRILVGPGAFVTPRFISDHNITHVINCASSFDSPAWYRIASPNTYVCLDAIDSPHHNILHWYPEFEHALHSFLRSNTGVVYVHCQAGMNRSGFLALTYICKNFHMDPEITIPLLQRQRPCLFGNTVYRNQVKEFIYGRLSSEENTGDSQLGSNVGDTGLSSSGCSSGVARLDVDTGRPPERGGNSSSDYL